MSKPRVNWHSATADAIQITLRDYEEFLEYHREYVLSGGAHRIDLLIIHKLLDVPITHPIARHFSEYNLFEIKGISSSVTINSYYKTLAYATLLISEAPAVPPHYRSDISLTFVSQRYPRELIKYLAGKCKLRIANPSPGIYNVSGDLFPVQFLVIGRLSPETSLYLRCLTSSLSSGELANRLAQDYTDHQSEPIYESYMNQLINANLQEKGVSPMCCEGIFKLYGTSSKEIAENAVAPVMEELNRTVEELDTAKKQNDYLRQLLDQHGIAYNC